MLAIDDHDSAKEVPDQLKDCNKFKRFTVRAAGETFVSFSCNPDKELMDKNISNDKKSTWTHACVTSVTLNVAFSLLITVLVTVLIYIYWKFTKAKTNRTV